MKRITFLAVLTLGFIFTSAAIAQDATTQPATAPATAPTITPAAKALLDQVREAYAGLKSLDLAGALTVDFDLAGHQEKHNVNFTASFAAPNKFRHEMEQ